MTQIDQGTRTHKNIQFRPKTSKSNNIENNHSKEFPLQNIAESICSENNSVSSKENKDVNFDSALKLKSQELYGKILYDEANRLELLKKHRSNLNEMNLIETNIEGLYEWNTLFNKSRPILSYTQINPSSQSKTKDDINQFTFPIALIDASEDKVVQYIPSILEQQSTKFTAQNNKTNKVSLSEDTKSKPEQHTYSIRPRQGNAVRPQSMYSTRTKTDIFYLSKAFSDYYNEDLKAFSKKMPILEAKLQIKKKKNKSIRAIKALREQASAQEYKYNTLIKKKLITLSPKLISMAGNLNHCEPLLKSIYSQTNSNENHDLDKKVKLYHKTAKPLGSANKIVDYTINNRNAHIEEIKTMKESHNSKGNRNKREDRRNKHNKCLSLPTYQENDPQLKIFKQLETKGIEVDRQLQQDQQIDQEIQCEEKTTMTIQSTLIKTRNKINKLNPKRPSTSHQYTTSTVSDNRRQFFSTNRSQSEVQYKSLSNHNRIVNIQTLFSYQNLNNSSSMNNTTASLNNCFEYIPKKSMPIRTISIINNPTYQRIGRKIKEKRKHPENCLNQEILLQQEPLIIQRGNNRCEAMVQTDIMRPSSSLTPNKGNSNHSIFNQFDKNSNEISHQKSLKSNFCVNLVYFNDYIDTYFSGTTNRSGNSNSNAKYNIDSYNNINTDKFKHYHKLNHFPVNCFNKGSCIRNIGNKRIDYTSSYDKTNSMSMNNINDKRRMSWQIKNCK